MRFFILTAFFCMATFISNAQFVYKIKADSVKITNDSCTAELILENSTKYVQGFLYNKGNGRTEFRKGLIKVNDSTYVIGSDTLRISRSGSYIENQTASIQPASFRINGAGAIEKNDSSTALSIYRYDQNGGINIGGTKIKWVNNVYNSALELTGNHYTSTGINVAPAQAYFTGGAIKINLNNNHQSYRGYGTEVTANYSSTNPNNVGVRGHSVNIQSWSGAYGYYANITKAVNSTGETYAFYAENGKSYFNDSVGIGTTTPQYKLDVNGTTNITTQGAGTTLLKLNSPFDGATGISFGNNIINYANKGIEMIASGDYAWGYPVYLDRNYTGGSGQQTNPINIYSKSSWNKDYDQLGSGTLKGIYSYTEGINLPNYAGYFEAKNTKTGVNQNAIALYTKATHPGGGGIPYSLYADSGNVFVREKVRIGTTDFSFSDKLYVNGNVRLASGNTFFVDNIKGASDNAVNMFNGIGTLNIGESTSSAGTGAFLRIFHANNSGYLMAGLSNSYYTYISHSPQTGNGIIGWHKLGATYQLFDLGNGTVRMPVLGTGTGNGTKMLTIGEDGTIASQTVLNLPASTPPTSSNDTSGANGDLKRDANGNLYLKANGQWLKFTGVTF